VRIISLEVPRALRAAARFFPKRIRWNWLGVVLSFGLIAIAAAVLYRELQGIDLNQVQAALLKIRPRNIALAACFVAAAYFTLTFYDFFALRTLGRNDVPYRVAALAGFTSYSVGHNVGASALTGGAVRYRIYSAHQLDAIDVAKVCFLAGLTFWLGNATVLGIGIAFKPHAASAIDRLPPAVNSIVASVVLAALATYLVWVWHARRFIGGGGWRVALPNGPSTLVQIGIGFVDLMCCALAMYVLVPDEPTIAFVELAVIFVSATLLGFASHAGRSGRIRRRDARRPVAIREGRTVSGAAVL
jgi:uncharacterized membrane protein YbhN (UPF0104 family)